MNRSKIFLACLFVPSCYLHASQDAPPSYAQATSVDPSNVSVSFQLPASHPISQNTLARLSQPAPQQQSMEAARLAIGTRAEPNQTTICDRTKIFYKQGFVKPFKRNSCIGGICCLLICGVPCTVLTAPCTTTYICCDAQCSKKCLRYEE